MARIERMLVNVTSNWVGFAVNAIVTLLLTPYVLGQLGIERYGVWILITSLIGSYGILDLGFTAGVNQALIRSISADDTSRAGVIMSTALRVLGGLAAIVTAVTIGASLAVPSAFDIAVEIETEAAICILITGLAASVQIAMSPFAAVFVAKQRFDLINAIGISVRLAGAAGIVLALRNDMGLVGVASATALATVAGYLARFILSRRLLPNLQISLREGNTAEFRDIASFGLWNFLISLSTYGYAHLLPIIIAAILPVAAVGHFALAAGLWQQLNALFTPVGQVVYPAAAELHVKKEINTLRKLYIDGTRLLMLVVVAAVVVAWIWADDFYALWIGPEYLSGDPFVSVSLIFRIMLVSTVLGYSVNFAGQVLMGAGHIRELALLKASSIVVTLLLSIATLGTLGLIAIPIAMLLGILIFEVIGLPIALAKREGLKLSVAARIGGIRPLMAATLLLTMLTGLRLLWAPAGWLELVAQGCLATGLIVLVVPLVGLKKAERYRYILLPLRNLLKPGRSER